MVNVTRSLAVLGLVAALDRALLLARLALLAVDASALAATFDLLVLLEICAG